MLKPKRTLFVIFYLAIIFFIIIIVLILLNLEYFSLLYLLIYLGALMSLYLIILYTVDSFNDFIGQVFVFFDIILFSFVHYSIFFKNSKIFSFCFYLFFQKISKSKNILFLSLILLFLHISPQKKFSKSTYHAA